MEYFGVTMILALNLEDKSTKNQDHLKIVEIYGKN